MKRRIWNIAGFMRANRSRDRRYPFDLGGKVSEYLVTRTPGDYGRSRMNVRGEPGPYLAERTR